MAYYYGLNAQNDVYSLHEKGYKINILDPTGAGDCFGATFVSLMLAGYSVEMALKYANASGALAVSKKDPMEGTSTLAELDQFITSSH